jgi:hypothetical protein
MALAAPVELVLVRFPKNQFRGEIIKSLQKLVSDKIIRIIDILLVTKDKQGNVTVAEMSDLDDEDYAALEPITSESAGLLSEDDAIELAKDMKKDSAAGIMLFEDTWARDLAESIDEAGGEVVVSERVPRDVVRRLSEE